MIQSPCRGFRRGRGIFRAGAQAARCFYILSLATHAVFPRLFRGKKADAKKEELCYTIYKYALYTFFVLF